MYDNKEYKMIYIAGPYTADTLAERIANVKKAIDVGILLYNKGHYPFIPHLTHYVDLEAKIRGTPVTWSEYMATDLAWLRFADAMFFIGRSKGADIEHTEALRMGIPIFYNIDEVPCIPFKERKEVKK